MIKKIFASILFFLVVVPSAAFAKTKDVDTKDKASLNTLLKSLHDETVRLNEQQSMLDEQYKELNIQKSRIDRLRARVSDYLVANDAVGEHELSEFRAMGAPKDGEAASASDNGENVGLKRKPKKKEKPPEIQALVDEGGVLLRKGTLVIEPSVQYSRSAAVRVAIEGFTIIPALNVGSFDITEVDRDTVTTALTARYGMTNRFEIEGRVPYVFREDSTLSRPIGAGAGTDLLTEIDGDDLGDVEFAAHYQLNKGKHGLPFFIGNLRFKTRTGTHPFEVATNATTGLQEELPTGSGFYSIEPSITAIQPSDPVVFYATLGYLYNFERDFGGNIGEIDPGDSIGTSFGMGFSANERASFSVGYSHDTVFKTTQNDITIPNSDVLQVGSLNFGYAYRVNDRTNINLNVGAGLTDDAPDVNISLRVPVQFDLLK